jgi:hypothetical protein
MTGPSPAGRPTVTHRAAVEQNYGSAAALATGFGAAVLEPTWWPADAGPVSYILTRFPDKTHYRVHSMRRDGVPVGLVGHRAPADPSRTPADWLDGDWSQPDELAHLRGLIGSVGIPTHLQGVLYAEQLELHLIGYDTKDEILKTATSLSLASPA